MTQKEAIDELMIEIGFILDEVEEHEEYEDQEQGEYQIQTYEDNKRKLEAYTVILGAIDPSLGTIEGLRTRCDQVREEAYGSSDAFEQPEPNEIEKELAEILTPWYKEAQKSSGGYETEFELSDEDNKILAKINMEKGEKRAMFDEDFEDAPELAEDDTFTFTPYRGRIIVGYNGYADGDFYSYPIEFQEKALEIIKKKLEEGK